MVTQKFPWRAIMIGSVLSVVVALYSAYAGLKVGGVYWPMVTTAVVCMALVKLIGGKDTHETNVMQTTASTGGLLAAGIIFTIPAIFLLGLPVTEMDIVLVGLTGGLLGLLFTYPLRKKMIEQEKLPYADGTAAAAIIKAGDSGGKQSGIMFAAFNVGAIFAILRDRVLHLPGSISMDSLKLPGSGLFSFGSSISLISLAGGYLIGLRFTLVWFLGAVATYFVIMPFAVSTGMFADKASVLVHVTKPLGTGMVIGAAIAFFITSGIPVFLRILSHYGDSSFGKKSLLAMLVLTVVMAYVFDLSLGATLIAVVGALIMAYVGARVTGEMNVDPMEIFAMLVLLAAKFIFGFGAVHLVLLAAVVCIAAGVAGDAMQDFKTGHILGTKPEHQLAGEITGVVAASLVMGGLMFSFASIGFGGLDFPAPQAVAVKEVAGGEGLLSALGLGIVIGIVATLAAEKKKQGSLPIAFGIGLYVPIELSVPLFAGGIIRHFVDKAKQTDKWRLVAAGVIAGEGLVGAIFVLASAAKFLGV